MSRVTFRSLVRQRLREARAAGIPFPVVSGLWPGSRQAQAIHRERHGRDIDERQVRQSRVSCVLETWTVTEAVHLLRRHGAVAGLAVARFLESVSEQVCWWLMDFQQPSLIVTAFGEEGRLFGNIVPYDRILETVCGHCWRKARGRGVLRIRLPDGQTTVVCGATRAEVVETIGLVILADTRCLPSLSTGAKAYLQLKDEDLALLLDTLFGKKPRLIAESL